MSQKPIPRKPELLTAAIIAEMAVCEERSDAQSAGLRVRCSASGRKVFFYRYRARDGALREIRLGDVGPLTLAKARDASVVKRLEREQGKAPQLDKRKEKARTNAHLRPVGFRATGVNDAIVVGMNRFHDAIPKGKMRRIVVRHMLVVLVMIRYPNEGRWIPRHLPGKVFIP